MSERPPNDGDRLGRRPADPPPVEELSPAPGWPRSAVLSVAALALIVLLLVLVVLT